MAGITLQPRLNKQSVPQLIQSQYIHAKGHAIPNDQILLVYFINLNTLFHNKQFAKCHLLQIYSACFSCVNLDTAFLAYFTRISKYATDFEQ